MSTGHLADRATHVAPELVGLTREQAASRVAGEDGLSIRFADEGRPVTLEYRFGRVTATVRDGVVVSATPG